LAQSSIECHRCIADVPCDVASAVPHKRASAVAKKQTRQYLIRYLLAAREPWSVSIPTA
jgi:hypothetical protein